jgi:hypothetical protein
VDALDSAPVVLKITPRHGPRRKRRSISYANRFMGMCSRHPSTGFITLFIKNLLPKQPASFRDLYPAMDLHVTIRNRAYTNFRKVFWDVMSCNSPERYQSFKGTIGLEVTSSRKLPLTFVHNIQRRVIFIIMAHSAVFVYDIVNCMTYGKMYSTKSVFHFLLEYLFRAFSAPVNT